MRRYELMLVVRPDLPDDKTQAVIDRTTRAITGSGGQIVKVAPWGRRRLAYPIDRHREGSYHIILFEAPADSVAELERGLVITEELLRHLVTRVERPVKAAHRDGVDDAAEFGAPPPPDDVDEDDQGERIDESESEAAPAAIE
jgi:small subunit ribosomal protein S6